MRSAVSGISLASSSSAPEAWRTLRISSQWPSSMMSISVTSSQKKLALGIDQRGQAVDEGDGDGQGDEGHHARLAVAQLGHGHLQEGHACSFRLWGRRHEYPTLPRRGPCHGPPS
jgi:hypothetical protein